MGTSQRRGWTCDCSTLDTGLSTAELEGWAWEAGPSASLGKCKLTFTTIGEKNPKVEKSQKPCPCDPLAHQARGSRHGAQGGTAPLQPSTCLPGTRAHALLRFPLLSLGTAPWHPAQPSSSAHLTFSVHPPFSKARLPAFPRFFLRLCPRVPISSSSPEFRPEWLGAPQPLTLLYHPLRPPSGPSLSTSPPLLTPLLWMSCVTLLGIHDCRLPVLDQIITLFSCLICKMGI